MIGLLVGGGVVAYFARENWTFIKERGGEKSAIVAYIVMGIVVTLVVNHFAQPGAVESFVHNFFFGAAATNDDCYGRC